jgi:hypothetical protein
MRNSRLAYKVTECYPVVQIIGKDNPIVDVNYDLRDPKDYRYP